MAWGDSLPQKGLGGSGRSQRESPMCWSPVFLFLTQIHPPRSWWKTLTAVWNQHFWNSNKTGRRENFQPPPVNFLIPGCKRQAPAITPNPTDSLTSAPTAHVPPYGIPCLSPSSLHPGTCTCAGANKPNPVITVSLIDRALYRLALMSI